MIERRFKHFLRERNEFSRSGDEQLLSVSEYYGVKPRAEAFANDEHETRAASLEGYRIVRRGDFVMNYMLAWKGAYGVSSHDGIVSPAYSVFEPDPRIVDRRYLHHRTRSDLMRAAFRSRSKGIIESRLRLYPDALLAMAVELPDLETQKAIADFLDRETARIDQLIEKKQRLSEVLADAHSSATLRIMQSGFSELDYDPESNRIIFTNLENGWRRVRVKHVVSHMTSGSRGWSDLIQEEGELFLQSGNIDRRMGITLDNAQRLSPQSGAEAKRTLVEKQDTLVCITGGRTGAVGFVDDMKECAYINQHVCLLRPSGKIHPRLLAQLLFSEIGQLQLRMAQYGLKQGMGFNEVANVTIPLPPAEAQARLSQGIDAASRQLDYTSNLVEDSIDRLREYRSALITAAVTGQINVSTYGRSGTTDRTLDRIEAEMGA